MPTWEEVQGFAYYENLRIVVRFRHPNTANNFQYFYQSTAEGVQQISKEARRRLKPGEIFRDPIHKILRHNGIEYYLAHIPTKKNSFTRVYNHIQPTKTWGWFRHGEAWIAYKAIGEHYWRLLDHCSAPTAFPLDFDIYRADPQAYVDDDHIPSLPNQPKKTQQQQPIVGIFSPRTPYTSPAQRPTTRGQTTAQRPESRTASSREAELKHFSRTGPIQQSKPRPQTPTSPNTDSVLEEVVSILSSPEFEQTIARNGELAGLAQGAVDNRLETLPETRLQSTSSFHIEAEQGTPPTTIVPTIWERLSTDMEPRMRREAFDADDNDEIDLRSLRAAANVPNRRTETSQPDRGSKRPKDLLAEEMERDIPTLPSRNPRIREAGRICAEIRNLSNSMMRNFYALADNCPSVLPGRNIQSPHPELLTQELVDRLNQVVTKCATDCTDILLEAQQVALDNLKLERKQLLENWEPTPEEIIEFERIRDARTNKMDPYSTRNRPPGPLPFFIAPDLSRGERLIVANREVGRFQSTGTRHSRGTGPTVTFNTDKRQGGARPRTRTTETEAEERNRSPESRRPPYRSRDNYQPRQWNNRNEYRSRAYRTRSNDRDEDQPRSRGRYFHHDDGGYNSDWSGAERRKNKNWGPKN